MAYGDSGRSQRRSERRSPTLDGAPARIIIGLVIPRSKKLAHIKTLAEIAKLLSRAEVRDRLLRCTDAAMAVAALAELQGPGR